MILSIDHLEPINMGNDQQEIADYVMEQVGGMSFDSKDDFNEGAFIEIACKELGWASTPQNGGFEVRWAYPIKIGGAQTSVSEEEMDKIISDLGISDNDWANLPSTDLIALIEEKSEGHYRFG